MLSDRIRQLLVTRPYLGSQTIAAMAKTTHGAVRATAARERINFIDRREVEIYASELAATLTEEQIAAAYARAEVRCAKLRAMTGKGRAGGEA